MFASGSNCWGKHLAQFRDRKWNKDLCGYTCIYIYTDILSAL